MKFHSIWFNLCLFNYIISSVISWFKKKDKDNLNSTGNSASHSIQCLFLGSERWDMTLFPWPVLVSMPPTQDEHLTTLRIILEKIPIFPTTWSINISQDFTWCSNKENAMSSNWRTKTGYVKDIKMVYWHQYCTFFFFFGTERCLISSSCLFFNKD